MKFPTEKNTKKSSTLAYVAALCILAGVVLTIIQFVEYNNRPGIFPPGSTWGGLEVGGISLDEAAQRVKAIYDQPLVLSYQGAEIQVTPEQIGVTGFDETTVTEQNLTGQDFWDFLWNRATPAVSIPIDLRIDRDTLQDFLIGEIAARYDRISAAPLPIPGSTQFETGQASSILDVDASIARIEAGYQSLDSRAIDLVIEEKPASPPDLHNLEVFLKQKLDMAGFNDIAEISILDLKSTRSLHFAYRNGENLPPDIAFSAASTIKIPIMISILKRVGEPLPEEVDHLIRRTMVLSENPPADQLMDQIIGADLAPLSVTEDVQKLGLDNTFLAGYFYLGAPLLRLNDTPANQRQDVSTSPDIYNQTTAGDMTVLLEALYQCAKDNKGLLHDTFTGEITQTECEYFLSVMAQNKIGVLFEAGVPEGTPVAHKHGWTEESDGYLHSLSDVGIIYGSETDVVLVIFLYDSNQLLFTPANELMAQLAQVVHNYFNPNNQIDWLFGEITYR